MVLERKASVAFPVTDTNRLTILRDGSSLEIFIDDAQDFDVSLYSAAGLRAIHTKASGGKAVLSVGNLPKGVYIIKAGGKTQKIII